jgi:hypothetical protein
MKKIVIVKKVEISDFTTTIDAGVLKTCLDEFEENMYLNYTVKNNITYKEIILKNFFKFNKNIIRKITPQYTRGAEIHIINEKRGLDVIFKNPNPKTAMYYSWQNIDYNALPKTLATFKYKVNNVETTVLDELKKLKTLSYLPHELWEAMDVYSQLQIKKCKEYNGVTNYTHIENFYKDMFKTCRKHNVWMDSPNEKTFYEGMAELEFEKIIKSLTIPVEDEITEEDLIFLKKYAPAYGVDIPKFNYKINSRETKHGYTQEPQACYTPMTDSDVAKAIYDYRNDNLPANVRKGLWQKSIDCPKYIKEAYERLKFYMELGDEFLMPGYHRCPQCGEIYHESRGCENCGGVEALEFLNAENLFYSNASAFEDMNATTDFYKEVMNALETDED